MNPFPPKGTLGYPREGCFVDKAEEDTMLATLESRMMMSPAGWSLRLRLQSAGEMIMPETGVKSSLLVAGGEVPRRARI